MFGCLCSRIWIEWIETYLHIVLPEACIRKAYEPINTQLAALGKEQIDIALEKRWWSLSFFPFHYIFTITLFWTGNQTNGRVAPLLGFYGRNLARLIFESGNFAFRNVSLRKMLHCPIFGKPWITFIIATFIPTLVPVSPSFLNPRHSGDRSLLWRMEMLPTTIFSILSRYQQLTFVLDFCPLLGRTRENTIVALRLICKIIFALVWSYLLYFNSFSIGLT